MWQRDVGYGTDWHPPGESGVLTGCGNEETRIKVKI